jgi:hypothetical protein
MSTFLGFITGPSPSKYSRPSPCSSRSSHYLSNSSLRNGHPPPPHPQRSSVESSSQPRTSRTPPPPHPPPPIPQHGIPTSIADSPASESSPVKKGQPPMRFPPPPPYPPPPMRYMIEILGALWIRGIVYVHVYVVHGNFEVFLFPAISMLSP